MKKLVFRLVLGVAFLALLALGLLVVFLGPIVKSAIAKGSTYATGVETQVADVDVGLRGGSFAMSGLRIANPQGFQSPHFLELGKVSTRIDNGSLFSDRIVLDELAIADVDVNLEQTGSGSNVGKILDNLKRVSGPKKPDEPSPDGGKQRSLTIHRITLRGVKVSLHVNGVAGLSGSQSIELPPIELTEFQSDGSTMQLVAKLTKAVVTSIADQTTKSGGGLIPKDLMKDLENGLGGLKDKLKGELDDVLKDPSKLDDAAKDLKGLFKKKP